MAPRAALLSAGTSQQAAEAAEVPASPASATRRLNELVDASDALHTAIVAAATPQQKQQALDGFVEAARNALVFYASLPRETAVRALPDAEVRTIRDRAAVACLEAEGISTRALHALRQERHKDADLIVGMMRLNAGREVPLDLTPTLNRATANRLQDIELWVDKAHRAENMSKIAGIAAGLENLSPQVREKDRFLQQIHIADALVARFGELHVRTDDANSDIWWSRTGTHGITRPGSPDDGLELSRHFDAFNNDIEPAFESTRQALMLQEKIGEEVRPLSRESVTVLEGVLGRLAEHASIVDEALAALRAQPDSGPPGLQAKLDRIVECTWLTADAVTQVLQLRPREAPARAEEAPAEPKAQRQGRRDKGKRRSTGSTSSGQRPAVAAPARQVIVRSELGTERLVSASEAAAAAATPSASSSAARARRKTLSKNELQQQLARLDELLTFDLPAQLRAVSQARRERSPDSARAVSEKKAAFLNAQAAELAACHQTLDSHRHQLSGQQVPVVHDKLGTLKVLLADVRGEARALHENLDGAQTDHLKIYRFPTQAHIETLLGQGQLAKGELQALKGEPGNLFELKLQPSALRNGKLPRPVWLHVHTREPVHAHQLATLDKAAFGATHLKSDEERGRNREWQDAQARAGHDNAMIYRGKITHELCRQLLGG